MDFEEQIRRIAKNIYEKVLSFVNENKEDDDLFYSYAFIKLNDGRIIRYDFEKDFFEIINSINCLYSWITDSRIKISKGNTKIYIEKEDEVIPKYKYLTYDTSLKDKIENENRERVKEIYKKQLLVREEISQEIKEKIKDEYQKIKSATSSLVYDKEKTHNFQNFNHYFKELCNSYLYDKEINALKESNDPILPAVRKAAEWWANKINIIEENDDRLWVGLSRKEPLDPITDEQLTKFKEILSKKIMEDIFINYENLVEIGVYNYPLMILGKSLEAAGISQRRIPSKCLTMYVRPYFVEVIEQDKEIIVYNSLQEEDVENIKQIYLEQLNNNNSYTLKNKI